MDIMCQARGFNTSKGRPGASKASSGPFYMGQARSSARRDHDLVVKLPAVASGRAGAGESMLSDFFDTMGIVTGVANESGLLDRDGRLRGGRQDAAGRQPGRGRRLGRPADEGPVLSLAEGLLRAAHARPVSQLPPGAVLSGPDERRRRRRRRSWTGGASSRDRPPVPEARAGLVQISQPHCPCRQSSAAVVNSTLNSW
jgi:hypothetical protein